MWLPFPVFFISSHGFKFFHFNPKRLPLEFLYHLKFLSRFAADTVSQFMFFWKYFKFPFMFSIFSLCAVSFVQQFSPPVS